MQYKGNFTYYNVNLFVAFVRDVHQLILNLIGCLVKQVQVVFQWVGVMETITQPDDT